MTTTQKHITLYSTTWSAALSTDDVIHALEGNWKIERYAFNKSEWQYKYEIDGFAIDGEPITVIIAVDTLQKEFTVVTRWRDG